MEPAREQTRAKQDVHSTTHSREKPQKTDADAIVKLDLDGLFTALVDDKSLAAEIVRVRPGSVGELIQRAYVTRSPLIAIVLVTELRKNTSRFAGPHGQLLLRSVLRLEGPGADEIRAVMEGFVRSDAEAAGKVGPDLGLVDTTSLDDRMNALKASKKDPAWGKLAADYYDRPEAAAAQLMREAKQDPALFKKHASKLATLFGSSRSSARFFVHELMKFENEMSPVVKVWVLKELHEVIGADMRLIDKGLDDHVDGGPQARAEQLVPTVAELMSQPEVARALVTIGRGGPSPVALPSLKHLLSDVLHKHWAKPVRAEARGHLQTGAAELLHGSLLAVDPQERRARTIDAANFIGQTAQAECAHGLEKSFASTVGKMLMATSEIAPGQAGLATKLGGKGLEAAGRHGDEKRHFTARDLEGLLRRAYTSVHPLPGDPYVGSQASNQYEYGYVSWQADAANEFARLEQDARMEEDCSR